MPNPVKNNHLSIAHVSSPQVDKAGDFIYRVDQPNSALASLPGVQVVELSNLSRHKQKIFIEADILIINLIGDPDFFPLIQTRRKAGRLTLFEINDYFLGFQPWNPVYYFFKDPENTTCILQLIEQCDGVQVTCRELKQRFSDYNSRITAFENQMTRVGSLEKEASPITIGWGGSHGHLEDIRQALPALVSWFKKHPEVRLSIMGSQQIYDLFSELDEDQKRYTPPGSLDDFYDFLQTLHIGLAPLEPTDYNKCRSDVKFLEYGAFGAVPVCADLEPYGSVKDGVTGLLFKDVSEIPSILDRLLQDPKLRKKIAANAHAYVSEHRMEKDHAEERIDFYRKELNRIEKNAPGPKTGRLAWLESLPESIKTGDTDYISLAFTPLEKDLYNGLVYQFQHQQTFEAIDCFRRADRTDPKFYVSKIYLGSALEQSDTEGALSAYEQALSVNPESCFAAVLLGLVHLRTGRYQEAVVSFAKATETAPTYARAWLLLGMAEQQAGETDKALACIDRALQEAPYYAPAYTQLGLLHMQQQRTQEAKQAFEKGWELNPEFAANCFFLGNIALNEGALDTSESWYQRALKLQPGLAAAHSNLSRLYRAQGKLEEAEKARAEAVRLQPDLEGKI